MPGRALIRIFLTVVIACVGGVMPVACHKVGEVAGESPHSDLPSEENQPAQVVRPSPQAASEAFQILSKASYLDNLVAGERVPAGEQVWAFNVLLRLANSKEAFQRLFSSDQHYARCYALIGLRVLGDAPFKAAAENFKRNTEKHHYIFGCQGMEITNSEFVDLLETERLKLSYFVISDFDAYIENKEKFKRASSQFMIGTGFGL